MEQRSLRYLRESQAWVNQTLQEAHLHVQPFIQENRFSLPPDVMAAQRQQLIYHLETCSFNSTWDLPLLKA